MKKVMLTGSTGFVGRNVLPLLKEKYIVYAPTRHELDLRDLNAVIQYVKDKQFDAVLHCANPNPVKNILDTQDKMFEDSMRVFYNFYHARNFFSKLLYLGSGAEYDKRYDICSFTEDMIGKNVPADIYGFSKLIMNELASKSDNVYNLRLFACYGPYDHESKFITHAIRSCINGKEVTIRQNCYFDYFHVFDMAEIFSYFIDNTPLYHDYNICSGKKITLEAIAEEVIRQMGGNNTVRILNEGLNKEYTADNSRLLAEMKGYEFIPIEKGIAMQIICEKEYWN